MQGANDGREGLLFCTTWGTKEKTENRGRIFRRQRRLSLEDVQDTLEDDADSVRSRIRYGRLCEFLARDVSCPTGLGLDPSGFGRSVDGSLDSVCEVGRGGGEGRDEGLEGVDEGT